MFSDFQKINIKFAKIKGKTIRSTEQNVILFVFAFNEPVVNLNESKL